MPRFAITEKAGRFVAGQNNTGVGTVLTLTEKQAEHEVRLGTLQPLDVPAAKDDGGKGKKASGGKAKAAAKPAAEGDAKQEANGDEKPAAEDGSGEGGGDE